VPDTIYKVVEVVGSSTESIADGARNAVSTASETLRNIEWFEIEAIRGHVVDGKVEHFGRDIALRRVGDDYRVQP